MNTDEKYCINACGTGFNLIWFLFLKDACLSSENKCLTNTIVNCKTCEADTTCKEC